MAPSFTYAADVMKPEEEQCRSHLQALGSALRLYLIHNDGQLPDRISDLYKQGFVLDPETFSCPGSDTRIANETEIDQRTDYLLGTPLSAERPAPIFKEKSGFHEGAGLLYYSDGSIRKITLPSSPAQPVPPVAKAPGAPAPDRAAALNKAGVELAQQKRLSEAEAAYREAIRLVGTAALYHFNLGSLLYD